MFNLITTAMEIVRNLNTLKAMQKHGVKWHKQTGTKIAGLNSSKKFTCYYVDEAPSVFKYKNEWYGQKYFDGCFMPYVVKFNI
jgi:hypothetical protein